MLDLSVCLFFYIDEIGFSPFPKGDPFRSLSLLTSIMPCLIHMIILDFSMNESCALPACWLALLSVTKMLAYLPISPWAWKATNTKLTCTPPRPRPPLSTPRSYHISSTPPHSPRHFFWPLFPALLIYYWCYAAHLPAYLTDSCWRNATSQWLGSPLSVYLALDQGFYLPLPTHQSLVI